MGLCTLKSSSTVPVFTCSLMSELSEGTKGQTDACGSECRVNSALLKMKIKFKDGVVGAVALLTEAQINQDRTSSQSRKTHPS